MSRDPWRRPASALALLVLLGTAAPATAEPTQPAATVVLDGVTVRLPSDGQQVVTVHHTHGSHARVVLWLNPQRQPVMAVGR